MKRYPIAHDGYQNKCQSITQCSIPSSKKKCEESILKMKVYSRNLINTTNIKKLLFFFFSTRRFSLIYKKNAFFKRAQCMTRPLPSPRKCNFTLEKYFAPSPKKQFTAVIHLSKIQSATSSKRDRHPIKEFLSNQQKLLQTIWGSEDPSRPAEEVLVFSSNLTDNLLK